MRALTHAMMTRSGILLMVTVGCQSENDLDLFADGVDVPVEDVDSEFDIPDPDTDTDADTEADTDVELDTDPDPDTQAPIACGDPIANAGIDQTIQPLRAVGLSGQGSSDPSGCTPLSYRWSVVSKPPGSTLFLLFANNRDLLPWIDIAGTYEFELRVTNSDGRVDTDRVIINAVPSQDFYVQLTWDAECDLDMHVLDGSSTLFDSPFDVCFCNQTGQWGGAGTADDGSLDWDAINGFGPETMTIQTPAAGTYDIKVHYYGMDGNEYCDDFGCPSTTATVRIYNQGTLLQTFTHQMNDQGELWNVATVGWPGLNITPVNTLTSTSLTSCF